MQPDYDDLDDLEEGGFNWMLVTVLLLAIAGFFSLAWYAYQTGAEHADNGEVVVIQADTSPVREAPQVAGGREFPHQEKTIYDAIRDDTPSNVTSIQLQPAPQEPQIVEVVEIEPEAISADAKVAEILERAVQEAQQDMQEEAAPKPQEQAEKPEPVAEPRPATAAVDSSQRVQLGAFRSNAEANKQWQKVLRANRNVLAGKSHEVVRADLGAKGVFYRLRVKGFADKDAAKALCKTLSARGQGCFVVR